MKPSKGFTLIELLVVVSIIALLVSILVPALSKAKAQAQFTICLTNLRQYGITTIMYLGDNDDSYYYPWESIYSDIRFPGEPERFCRWHNADYDLERYPEYGGPFWPYLEIRDINLCPRFLRISKQNAMRHPRHVDSIPIFPVFSYSMNTMLGNASSSNKWRSVKKSTQVGSPDYTFVWGEENMWVTSGINGYVLNDNALLVRGSFQPSPKTIFPPFTDSLGTFHQTPDTDLDGGVTNVVMVDGHVETIHVEDSYRLARPK